MPNLKDIKRKLEDLKATKVDEIKTGVSGILDRLEHDGDVEVTIYPSCGSLQGNNWQIPLRGWVHQNRRLPDHLIRKVVDLKLDCTDAETNNFDFRFDGFTDDSRHGQSVTIQFDNDNERYQFPTSDGNGLIETTVSIPAATVDALAGQQNSRERWLSFNVVSARLITSAKRLV